MQSSSGIAEHAHNAGSWNILRDGRQPGDQRRCKSGGLARRPRFSLADIADTSVTSRVCFAMLQVGCAI
jgi:hypothetical protein